MPFLAFLYQLQRFFPHRYTTEKQAQTQHKLPKDIFSSGRKMSRAGLTSKSYPDLPVFQVHWYLPLPHDWSRFNTFQEYLQHKKTIIQMTCPTRQGCSDLHSFIPRGIVSLLGKFPLKKGSHSHAKDLKYCMYLTLAGDMIWNWLPNKRETCWCEENTFFLI